ncbi:MAG TPA: hypothetical protein VK766_01245, partial [Cytophagaceae bacterium]|nr:hypothetical protein [Cytophagaceae bacterium]
MFYPLIETKPKEEIKKWQESKLPDALQYLQNNSKFYAELFFKNNIDVSKIKTIEDLSLIPFTTKDEVQLRNQDFICVDKSKIIDYVTTSGTLGEPVIVPLTDKDLERLAYNEAISFVCAG